MRGKEFAGGRQKHRTLRRQPHGPGRTLKQPLAQPVFQPLQLDADGTLRGSQSFGSAGEALQIGNGDKSLDGIHIQRAQINNSNLLSLK